VLVLISLYIAAAVVTQLLLVVGDTCARVHWGSRDSESSS